jgi:CO/xanthine dehydrogenase Mo-binding subunit
MAASERWVGKSLERFEDAALLTGRARFMDDLEPAASTALPIFAR